MLPMNKRSVSGKILASAGIIALTGVIGLQLLGTATAETVPAAATKPTTSALPVSQTAATTADRKQMLVQYCSGCHNDKMKTAGMSVLPLKADDLDAHNPGLP